MTIPPTPATVQLEEWGTKSSGDPSCQTNIPSREPLSTGIVLRGSDRADSVRAATVPPLRSESLSMPGDRPVTPTHGQGVVAWASARYPGPDLLVGGVLGIRPKRHAEA